MKFFSLFLQCNEMKRNQINYFNSFKYFNLVSVEFYFLNLKQKCSMMHSLNSIRDSRVNYSYTFVNPCVRLDSLSRNF